MEDHEKKILLMGNPNVGKSAIFSRLTGAKVTISNYPGTTVGFSQGRMKLSDKEFGVLMDVPGVYNLDPLCRADEVACGLISSGDIIVNVLDATNLERGLFLTLELIEKNKPVVVALNMWDETRHKGIEINTGRLEEMLGVPVVTTCGITGEGIKALVERIRQGIPARGQVLSREEKWKRAGEIISGTQILHHHHHTVLEALEEVTTRPVTGLPVALVVLYLSFLLIRAIAENLIYYVLDPLFEQYWIRVVDWLNGVLGSGVLREIMIGGLVDGKIDFGSSFGLLTTGLYVPLAAVLPYIISFYFVLGIIEDSGYLPRLATQVDNFMHKIGLHGYAIVPMILGLGCNVPGAMALRLLENRREKFIAATLMAITVPCMAQIAMIVGLVGERGGKYVALIFGILFVLMVVKGLILNRVMKGASPEILWEIPPYRMPQIGPVLKKLWMRISGFMKEALPMVLGGVLLVNLLYMFRVLDVFATVLAPVFRDLWGLPEGTISAMVIGFLRKDVAVGMLGPLDLSTRQLVIACTILTIYFPCVATFTVMIRELGIKDMIRSVGIMLVTALTVGGVLNLVLWK
ncbi:MAG: ferrous iron transporter B [Candidatus Omnitrophica bacterium]|nr:ferrous iron transporter B [Candidatus Omnitrophota bacterium]MDD5488929.1 ferrous iron transporter B [Candidatus Omnitrophota bacterium]